MNRPKRSAIKVIGRSLRLQCPVCGQSSIVARPFNIKHQCTSCKAVFKREDGFFVGAILANVVATEGVILAVYVISLPIFAAHYQLVLGLLFMVAVLFPLAFYHHSWSLWLGLDELVEGLQPA
ncbi:MAG TPA: hypothetical protein VGN86_13280 [Pyrinomonadaceae bacterium]|nr:hypothetical protein [Pyrinomonadaceae bacterium]